MKALLATIEAWRADGQAIARAVVVRTFGSAPRPAGATLLLSTDGRIAGSVSGGCVEAATVTRLEEARAAGRRRVVRFGISDEQAQEVGLACGGTIDVLVEPSLPEAVVLAAGAAQHDRAGARAVITPLPAGSPGPQLSPSVEGPAADPEPCLVAHADGRLEGTLGTTEADRVLVEVALAALARGRSEVIALAGRELFCETFSLPPRLVVVGAVPVAMSLVRLARELGLATVVIDGRPAFVTSERFPDVEQRLVGWLDECADELELGPADAVVVLSHDPKFDDPAIVEAFRRGCRYVGAIGSRRTQQQRRGRLLVAGVAEEDLARLHAPVGLDLGGREPAETALAILAEVVAARHGASGQPMRDVVAGGVSDSQVRALDSDVTLNPSR